MEFEDMAPNVFAAVLILAICAFIVFPLRLYIRITKNAWGYDDWCMSIGAVPFLVLTVVCLGGSFHGVGVHQSRLDEAQQTTGRLWFFLFEVFFCISIIFIKLSIAFMLARIAEPMRQYVYALWSLSALVTVMNLIAMFGIIFNCLPVPYFWDRSIKNGSCKSSSYLADIYYADTAVNIAVDWFCALLPVPLLWSIQMNRNTKISVAFLLGLGVFASLSACIRLKYTVNLNNSDDFLYSVGDIVIWGYAENATGMIVGCISCLRPLFSRLFHLNSTKGTTEFQLKGAVTTRSRAPLGSSHGDGDQPEWAKTKHGKSTATVKSGQKKRSSGLSFSDSEEELVRDMLPSGIRVQRDVSQRRDLV